MRFFMKFLLTFAILLLPFSQQSKAGSFLTREAAEDDPVRSSRHVNTQANSNNPCWYYEHASYHPLNVMCIPFYYIYSCYSWMCSSRLENGNGNHQASQAEQSETQPLVTNSTVYSSSSHTIINLDESKPNLQKNTLQDALNDIHREEEERQVAGQARRERERLAELALQQRIREEDERRKEAIARTEAERVEAEETARIEAERVAAEEAERVEAERVEAEKKAVQQLTHEEEVLSNTSESETEKSEGNSVDFGSMNFDHVGQGRLSAYNSNTSDSETEKSGENSFDFSSVNLDNVGQGRLSSYHSNASESETEKSEEDSVDFESMNFDHVGQGSLSSYNSNANSRAETPHETPNKAPNKTINVKVRSQVKLNLSDALKQVEEEETRKQRSREEEALREEEAERVETEEDARRKEEAHKKANEKK